MDSEAIASLKQFEVLRRVDRAGITELEQAATRRAIARDSFVVLPGRSSDAVFFLASGRVKVSRISRAGKEFTLDILSPGHSFGDVEAAASQPHESLFETLEDTELWVVPARVFRKVAIRNPELLFELARRTSRRTRELEQRILDASYKNGAQRLADLLLRLGKRHGVRDENGLSVPIRLTQAALGNLIGMSREMVNVALCELRRRGIVGLSSGRLVIRNQKALEALAA